MAPPRIVAILLSLLLPAASFGQVPDHTLAADDPAPAALQTLRDRFRPLLIFTPSEAEPAFLRQVEMIAAHAPELADRDVAILSIPFRRTAQPYIAPGLLRQVNLTPLGESEARALFHVPRNSFTVLLIGKDGGEKLRVHIPLSFERLASLIDSMPMRQQERNRLSVEQDQPF